MSQLVGTLSVLKKKDETGDRPTLKRCMKTNKIYGHPITLCDKKVVDARDLFSWTDNMEWISGYLTYTTEGIHARKILFVWQIL